MADQKDRWCAYKAQTFDSILYVSCHAHLDLQYVINQSYNILVHGQLSTTAFLENKRVDILYDPISFKFATHQHWLAVLLICYGVCLRLIMCRTCHHKGMLLYFSIDSITPSGSLHHVYY